MRCKGFAARLCAEVDLETGVIWRLNGLTASTISNVNLKESKMGTNPQ